MQRDAIHLRRFSSGRLGYATRPLSTELPPPKRNLSPVTHCPVRAGSLVIAPAMISPLGSFFRFSRKGGRLTTAFVQRRTHNANQSRSTLATLTGHTIPLFWHGCLTRRRPNRLYQPFLPFGTAPTRRPLFPPSLASRHNVPKYDRSRGYDAAAAKSGTGHDSKIWSRISAIGLDHCGSSVEYMSTVLLAQPRCLFRSPGEPGRGWPAIARCQHREELAKNRFYPLHLLLPGGHLMRLKCFIIGPRPHWHFTLTAL
ncbi:hypothetical protein CTAM01_09455 [Colletotrichum tamarilloi]|uniref:Uncharacterized protein n=1 Tax=Colletotrichum tamarilloi TaxID=1209934 RepID=A0ABQ9R3S6_9PEZI|nr:uncharacterized protein CTAM01_09455 [Colletotrichum tamarilloi]KAK1493311.1 hypothetical protein CTAM01_09455 [Colletotrichum tamarilloi]